MIDDDDQWLGPERRTDAVYLRRAVLHAIDDYCADPIRVKKAVHTIVEALTEELSSGAGRALFSGVRRIAWIVIIALLVLGFGGWTAAISFIKGAFTHAS